MVVCLSTKWKGHDILVASVTVPAFFSTWVESLVCLDFPSVSHLLRLVVGFALTWIWQRPMRLNFKSKSLW